MQQSSATQSLHLSFWGLRKIVACYHSSSQCLLVSTVFGTVSSLHPTSFLMIFTLVSQRGGSPFVYRDRGGWPASPPYICKICVSVAIGTQSEIRLHKRVPMVKIWGSSKNDQNWTTGKLLKL